MESLIGLLLDTIGATSPRLKRSLKMISPQMTSLMDSSTRSRPASHLACSRSLSASHHSEIFPDGRLWRHGRGDLDEAIPQPPSGKNWTNNGKEQVPIPAITNKGHGAVHVTVRSADGRLSSPAPNTLPQLWNRSPVSMTTTSDINSFASPAGPAKTGPDASVVDHRGCHPRRSWNQAQNLICGRPTNWQHGRRRGPVTAVGRGLASSGVWLEIMDVEVIPGDKRRKARRIRVESRALSIETASPAWLTSMGLLAARVKPGELGPTILGTRCTPDGLLAQRP